MFWTSISSSGRLVLVVVAIRIYLLIHSSENHLIVPKRINNLKSEENSRLEKYRKVE